MLLERCRHNYVTHTNYLELVKRYRQLLAEKSGELQCCLKHPHSISSHQYSLNYPISISSHQCSLNHSQSQ